MMENEENPGIYIIEAGDVGVPCDSYADTEDDKADIFFSPYPVLHQCEETKQDTSKCGQQEYIVASILSYLHTFNLLE